MYKAPNHIKVIKTACCNYGKIANFPKWYVKIYRYNIRENAIRDSTINWTKRFLQWSWMKFLTPLAADENTNNVAELTKHTID